MITITDKNTKQTYKLEYTRATALEAEARGLVLSENSFEHMPLKIATLLETTAFEAHHPELTVNERFAIVEACGNKSGLARAIMAEFAAVGTAFMNDDEADEKNGAEWTVE